MSDSSPRILLVDDDARIRASVVRSLRTEGFVIDECDSLANSRAALPGEYDLVLLDLGLPDGDGILLCSELREKGNGLPIIVLTARDAPEDRVRGLDSGADDYLVKPFHMPELVARIRSVLRRASKGSEGGRLSHGELWADPVGRAAGKGDVTITLKRREFDLLYFLLRRPGRVWTRDQLIDHVWGPTFGGDSRTVDLHVRRLRTKIEDVPSDPRWIETVWGVGYRLAELA